MTRLREWRSGLGGSPYREHTLNSEEAFERISRSPLFYDPPQVWSYGKLAEGTITPMWRLRNLLRPNCAGRTSFQDAEKILLDAGFQYIWAYDGNPKMVVRPYLCELVEGEQFTGRFTYVTNGYDMVGFDDPRDALLFRMGDVHEEFLSNVPA